MTTRSSSSEERDRDAAGRTETGAGSEPVASRTILDYRLQLSIIALNLTGLVALVFLVGWHGVSRTDVAIFVSTYFLGMLGVEVGLHRYFSHRAFEATPPLRLALAVLGAMAGQGTALAWATTHRKHHRFSDGSADPHSPMPRRPGLAGILTGLWHAHFGWYFADASAIHFRDYHRYSRDLTTDRSLMRADRHVWTWVGLGLLLPTLAGYLITGTLDGTLTAFFWGGPIRILFVDNATWGVNSLAHTYGKRPFASRDRSSNLAWLAVISLGASWHNNHHVFPASSRTALQRGQIDIGFWCIRLFETLGLAHSVQVAEPRDRAPSSSVG